MTTARPPVRRPATYADLEALPEHVVGEIIDDELIVSPRPRPRHAVTTSSILGDLVPPFRHGREGPGGWWILVEPELHLGRNVLVPDIGGWHRERLPTIPEEVGIRVVPDWVCEVLSPSTARIDRIKKMRTYARHGVAHVWLVDPVLQTLEVYSLHDGLFVLRTAHAEDECVRVDPFAAVELALADWWADGTEPSPANEPPASYTP